jgi:hypothetical protein
MFKRRRTQADQEGRTAALRRWFRSVIHDHRFRALGAMARKAAMTAVFGALVRKLISLL